MTTDQDHTQRTFGSLHVNLTDDPTIRDHVGHGDGRHSWAITGTLDAFDVYLVGTPEQLETLARRMLSLASLARDAEAAS